MARMFPEGALANGGFEWSADVDVERLKNRSLQLYLWRSLERVDDQIVATYQKCERMLATGMRRSCWTAAEESQLWKELFELDYLESSREAILEVLHNL